MTAIDDRETASTDVSTQVRAPHRAPRHELFSDAWLVDLERSTVDVADAATLPPELYTSPAVLDMERDALFAKEWLCVGRAEKLAEPALALEWAKTD